MQDPEVVADMYNKHNKNMDKHPAVAEIFEPLCKNIFGFMPTNEAWRSERKAVSHMFFKQRLAIMVNVFKEHLNISCNKWLAEIEKTGSARINIAEEFERVNAHAMNHICFGEDLNDDKFDFLYYDALKYTFTERKVSMREAIHNLTK